MRGPAIKIGASASVRNSINDSETLAITQTRTLQALQLSANFQEGSNRPIVAAPVGGSFALAHAMDNLEVAIGIGEFMLVWAGRGFFVQSAPHPCGGVQPDNKSPISLSSLLKIRRIITAISILPTINKSSNPDEYY